LVLVPEIALTPSLEGAFRSRFPGARLVVQHSEMPEGERARGWLQAQSGDADIVLGTRLAVFVPLARPGLLVVDEEQDMSFKQRDGLRYSARDVAVFRARESQVPVLLVSATPSLETLQHALTGRYRMLRLARRAHVGAHLAPIRLVDCRTAKLEEGLSVPLLGALEARLARGEQSLVFLNRRGYAPVLACGLCGWVSGCPRCSACLVVHLGQRILRCHHCGREERIPRSCPTCGNLDLVPFGRGTQRLESALVARFPAARILRIDSDSARGHAAGLIEKAQSGEADILIGTQMLAKGHHFERVTLVGVVNADAGLFAADYRAPERLFAQLQQVSGRAGRAGLPGEVMIQTRFPDHALYRALQAHDYEGYAATLLEERREAGFPPFMYEAALRAEAPEMEHALGFLGLALVLAPTERDTITIYDPAPASLARVAALERAQAIVQSPSRPALQRFLGAWSAALYERRWPKVRWHFDVDPVEF
jgi:primosomal protein N' (replication factor Y)